MGNSINEKDEVKGNAMRRRIIEEARVIICSKIIVENSAWTIVKWQLYNLLGDIYTSEKYTIGEEWEKELKELNIPEGTQFMLKARVKSGTDSISDVVLQYDSNSSFTAYFELTGTTRHSVLKYKE